MSYFRSILPLVLIATAYGQSFVATPEITIQGPKPIRFVQPVLNPFNAQRRYVGQAKMTDSPRLEQLVRAGNLYLSVDDVIALVLENNLDIAITIDYPLDGSIFPPEITPPTFIWRDAAEKCHSLADRHRVRRWLGWNARPIRR